MGTVRLGESGGRVGPAMLNWDPVANGPYMEATVCPGGPHEMVSVMQMSPG